MRRLLDLSTRIAVINYTTPYQYLEGQTPYDYRNLLQALSRAQREEKDGYKPTPAAAELSAKAEAMGEAEGRKAVLISSIEFFENAPSPTLAISGEEFTMITAVIVTLREAMKLEPTIKLKDDEGVWDY